MRQLHSIHSKFATVNHLRVKLIEELEEQVPDSLKFGVGYFDGRHQMSLVSVEDLKAMYSKHRLGGEVLLWCEDRCKGQKHDAESGGLLKRQEKEEELEKAFKYLKDKHADKYSLPQLRLWSRIVSAGLHSDTESPPDIPAFRSSTKRPRKESLGDTITGATVTFAKALKESSASPQTPTMSCVETSMSAATGISPGKAVELRMKNLEQLRYLQNLLEDGILTEKEYAEQKTNIIIVITTEAIASIAT